MVLSAVGLRHWSVLASIHISISCIPSIHFIIICILYWLNLLLTLCGNMTNKDKPIAKVNTDREVIIVDDLLDACVASVQAYGLQGMKMSHIIERSGVSRRTAYKYFANKEAIVAAAYHREGVAMFHSTWQAASVYDSVEDIFVCSFLYACQHIPQNPMLSTLIHENRDLLESFQLSDQSAVEMLLHGLDLGILFGDHPRILNDIFALAEYWVQVIASFLLLGIGRNMKPDEIEAYVRKRFVPGLHLEEYGLCYKRGDQQ